MLTRNGVLMAMVFASALGLVIGRDSKARAQGSGGVIAYVHNRTELRMINPDGTNDRKLWTAPSIAPETFTVTDLDWSPDASSLAFGSRHERATSLFEHDIYTIRPDGSGLRKLTNGPNHSELAGLPKGSVTVTINNQTANGPLLVYVVGAPAMQTVTGQVQTLTFENVADLGPNTLQGVVAVFGKKRWFRAVAADVQPNATVNAGTMIVAGSGTDTLGAYLPSWRSNGTQVGFLQGCGGIKQISANPEPASLGTFAANPPYNGIMCTADWGPGPAHGQQVLYSELFLDGKIYSTSEGSREQGQWQLTHPAYYLLMELEWLPDGSGFLYVLGTDFDGSTWQSGNVSLYRFATKKSTQLTNFSGKLVRAVSVSPDGTSIAYDLASHYSEGPSDLWVMRSDGTGQRLLATNAGSPAWSQRAPQLPRRVFLPLTQR